MTMKQMMSKYFMGEIDAISLIRMLSGMFDPEHATSLLTLICTITRHEQGDIDTETFNEVWKFGIDLKFNGGDYPEEYDTMPMEALKKVLEDMTARQTEKVEQRKNSADPIVDEEGISIEADLTGLEHDTSLLISYLMYRERKNMRETKEESIAKETNG